MLDINFIRHNPDKVQQAADNKGIAISVSELLDYDQKRREFIQEIDTLRAERNKVSKEVPKLKGDEKKLAIQRVKEVNVKLSELEAQFEEVNKRFNDLMLLVPSVPLDDVPVGETDEDNVEIRKEGIIPEFDFPIKDHVTLGEMHDMIDIPRGVKIAGSRMYFLKGKGAMLHRAVIQLTLDFLAKRNFTPMVVPVMVHEKAMYGTGYFPLGKEQTYVTLDDTPMNFVGTAEVPLVSYYSDEVLDVSQLPIRMAGVSDCFRREVGSAGKDTRGLYRVHQFTKVEQVVIAPADPVISEQIHYELLSNAEEILKLLELPYRVVEVCTGDMGQGQVKKHDIETWMPSREKYSETHSCSSFFDFQARRSGIKYKDETGRSKFCYTLNNTAIASPRILIPLLENHQQADGSIYIPKALRPYLDGVEKFELENE
ncbi:MULTISPECIES: serine--tRNA ligase [unclassified Thermoactinomyces]|uniref:serine--tRNA ligase n=1 Tax=unclassified Thermoactinomyces TaxID=2634588 RepID=UPI0018DB6E24|nr:MULTISPECIES: serine--tRNA ligase [unclassified Thermoactinomyces]MBH8599056.1 serine--tRNA ligase [Thermoactinomyces sp. CICC 10523]MBH8608013.1 serine--tRNA ligase [Thermoactinomyces sp. CICC 10521]